MTSPESLADQVLSSVGTRAGEASVTVTHRRQGLTRFANSSIHQNVGDEHTSVALTVVLDGRRATATSSLVTPAAIGRLVDSTLAAAAVQPVDTAWPGVAGPAALSPAAASRWDGRTASAEPGDRAAIVASFVGATDGFEAAGYCETVAEEVVSATTAGQHVSAGFTSATVDGIARHGGCDGVGSYASSRIGDLDGERCGTIAASSVLQSAAGAPIDLPPGRYQVVLSPRCVAYMLDFLTVYGFNAKMVQEQQSFATLGETQFDESLSMWDDALDPRSVGLGFDTDGTPKRRVDLVSSGRVVGLTHDRRTALADGDGASSSGHAVGSPSLGAVATNLYLAGASPEPVEDLVAGVGRGLLVRDFWYARVLNPKSLVVTGLTRNGVFLIDDGVVGRPVSNLRFTQSPVAALGPGAVLGAGDDARLAPGGLHVSSHHAPSLRLAGWNFTGGVAG